MEKWLRVWLVVGMLAMGVAVAGAAESEPLVGPYVTQVTGSSAKVLWVPASEEDTSTVTVDQGAKAEIGTRAIPRQTALVHVASVSGLKPGLTYHYHVVFSRAGKGIGEVGGEFRTPPGVDFSGPIHFVVYGDNRTYPKRAKEVADAIDKEGPLAFVINTGDLVEYTTVWPAWKREFFDPTAELLRRATFWPVLGNHETMGAGADHAAMWRAIFDLPTRRYYSFDYGNVHWAALDCELGGDKANPEMLAWLEKDLAASKATWKLVSYHRPTFDIVTYRDTWGKYDVWPVLEKYGVDMVINGHTHNYQRFRPIGETGHKPIISIVAAGGGAPSYPIFPSPVLEKTQYGLNYCDFTIHGNTLEMTAKSPDGKVIDRIKLVKTDGMYQKEIMDREMTQKEVQEEAFLLTGFLADAAAPPKAGEKFVVSVPRYVFPVGAKVEIAAAVEAPAKTGELVVPKDAPVAPGPADAPRASQWSVEPVTLTGWTGKDDLSEEPETTDEPFQVTLTAPAKVRLDEKKGIVPAPVVSLRVTYKGQTYTTNEAGIFFHSARMNQWLGIPPKGK